MEYLDLAARVAAADKERIYAAQLLSEGMRVLDFGCGTGDDVRAIAQRVGSSGSVTGIDSNPGLIEIAKARGVPANAQFVAGVSLPLPFADASFDAVRAERVFQHLREPEPVALEFRRVLRSGGSALLYDQDWSTMMLAGADLGVTQRLFEAMLRRIANPRAGRYAGGVLRRAGFSSIEIYPMVATAPLPVAFELIFEPAIEAALADGAVDAETAKNWLRSLLEADRSGEYFFGVTVIGALGRC